MLPAQPIKPPLTAAVWNCHENSSGNSGGGAGCTKSRLGKQSLTWCCQGANLLSVMSFEYLRVPTVAKSS